MACNSCPEMDGMIGKIGAIVERHSENLDELYHWRDQVMVEMAKESERREQSSKRNALLIGCLAAVPGVFTIVLQVMK